MEDEDLTFVQCQTKILKKISQLMRIQLRHDWRQVLSQWQVHTCAGHVNILVIAKSNVWTELVYMIKANGVSVRETAYTEDEYRGPTGNE